MLWTCQTLVENRFANFRRFYRTTIIFHSTKVTKLRTKKNNKRFPHCTVSICRIFRDEICRNGDLLNSPALNYTLLDLSAAVNAMREAKSVEEQADPQCKEEENDTAVVEDGIKVSRECGSVDVTETNNSYINSRTRCVGRRRWWRIFRYTVNGQFYRCGRQRYVV